MTTIIIGRELLEQALGQLICNTNNMQKGMSKSIQKLCARENAEVLERLRTALAAPATAPEPVAWMSPKRFYRTRAMALINGEQLIEPLYLRPPATAPERKPMHEGEIQAAWLGQDLDEPIPYSFVLGIRSAERFNGIKETP